MGIVQIGSPTGVAGPWTRSDVAGWIRDSVRLSLKRAGFELGRAQSVEGRATSTNEVAIQLYRIHTSVSYLGKMTGEIQALCALETPQGTINKTVEGVASFDTAIAVGSTYQQALNLALEDFVRNAISWIRDNTVADRQPAPSIIRPSP